MKYQIIGVVLAQKFSLKDGLKKFGNPGEKSSVKELTQIHDTLKDIPAELPGMDTEVDNIDSSLVTP